jgi:lysophospholipase L1-like esterase
MWYKSQSTLLFIFILSASYVDAQNISHKPATILCIGNSITAGARTLKPMQESYPAVLQSLLSTNGYEDYQTRNLGIGGATMLKFGTPNLWRTLDSVRKYVPDIVIIKAGTNETVGSPRMNWEHIGDFEKDYTEFIMSIKGINPAVKIILCSPLDMVLETLGLSPERLADLQGRRPRIWELRTRVKALAKKNDAYFCDLTKAFRNKPELLTTTDGVHPNVEGYRYLAEVIFRFLVRQRVI